MSPGRPSGRPSPSRTHQLCGSACSERTLCHPSHQSSRPSPVLGSDGKGHDWLARWARCCGVHVHPRLTHDSLGGVEVVRDVVLGTEVHLVVRLAAERGVRRSVLCASTQTVISSWSPLTVSGVSKYRLWCLSARHHASISELENEVSVRRETQRCSNSRQECSTHVARTQQSIRRNRSTLVSALSAAG